MKTTLTAITTAALVAAATSASASTITASLTAPTVDGGDIANLGAPAAGQQLLWGDRGVQGQSFTTGADASLLFAITYQLNEGGNAPIQGWKDYQFRFGTITGSVGNYDIAPTLVEVTRYDFDEPNFTFFTYTFDAPIALAANTTYYFDVGIENSQNGWPDGIPAIQVTGDNYAGGSRWNGARPNQIDNTTGVDTGLSNPHGNDLIFHADIVVIPEPGSMALLGLGGLLIARRRRA